MEIPEGAQWVFTSDRLPSEADNVVLWYAICPSTMKRAFTPHHWNEAIPSEVVAWMPLPALEDKDAKAWYVESLKPPFCEWSPSWKDAAKQGFLAGRNSKP
jgi:hypothetical protein